MLKGMRGYIAIVLILCVPAVASAGVYKWMDADGKVIYSDKPHPGAEEVKSGPVQTYSTPPISKPRSGNKDTAKEEGVSYTRVVVVSPSNDATVRDNAGNILVAISIEPSLNTSLKHQVVLLFDGKQVGEGSSTPAFQLTNVDRGTHTVQANVVGPDASVLGSSEPVTFHLKRHSIKN